ncbi:Hypothetical protein CINCED_3A009778 [Cinara cedri]|uniref:Uncharacterized protein n=1 Tax=Cinara cedri TaxID=506608 RepID=A0A5E4M276_9HEMI|nr:Hypothetical protein CINCED_3A009778 [Cinara cedri]
MFALVFASRRNIAIQPPPVGCAKPMRDPTVKPPPCKKNDHLSVPKGNPDYAADIICVHSRHGIRYNMVSRGKFDEWDVGCSGGGSNGTISATYIVVGSAVRRYAH